MAVFSKRNRKDVLCVQVKETLVEVSDNLKKLWKHSHADLWSHSISCPPKLLTRISMLMGWKQGTCFLFHKCLNYFFTYMIVFFFIFVAVKGALYITE